VLKYWVCHLVKMKSFLYLQVLLQLGTQTAFAEDILIDNGVLLCDQSTCSVTCDFGYIPNGPFQVPMDMSGDAVCERPVAVVAGGYNRPYLGDDTFLSSAELYSSKSSDECDGVLPSLPFERKGMFGGWVGGVAVICGGEDINAVVYSECYYLSSEVMSWVFLQEMQIERSFAAVEIIDGCLLVTGGKSMASAVDSVEVIGGDGCEWSGKVEKMPTEIYGHCLVEVAGELVVIGGSPESYGKTYVFNLETGVWRNGTRPGKERALHGCTKVVVGEEEGVLVAGNDYSPQDTAEVYFPSSDSWKWTRDMKNERTGGGMLVLGGKPTMLGGYGGDYCCKEFYITAESYNAASDHWSVLNVRNMTEGRKNPAVFGVPSSLFPNC